MYAFLQGLTLKDTGRQKSPKTTNPEGMVIRIFANGDVYPSQELVNTFNLEYKEKEAAEQGNGFDIIDSTDWTPTASLPERMILIGVTPKTESKVDIFAACRYNTDGTPKSSVITQGSTSETLLNLVRSMGYLTEDQKYCDLQVVLDHPITMEDGIANIPKLIEKGPNKGEKTYARRENVTFYVVNTPENLTATTNTTAPSEAVTTPVETN